MKSSANETPTQKFRKPELFRPLARIPRLYYGPQVAPRSRSSRERLADSLYAVLLILSYGLLILGGLFGYATRQEYGLLLFAFLGYGIGIWMRRSLGIRGRKATTGFFQRMRERALGSRPGALEWLLESVSGKEFTPEKCRAVIQAYEQAVKRLKVAKKPGEQTTILAELDRKVHQILMYP